MRLNLYHDKVSRIQSQIAFLAGCDNITQLTFLGAHIYVATEKGGREVEEGI